MGRASGNAKLRVSFFRPFYGDYWVLALGSGQDYGWVLVGEPTRKFGWVLSRTPTIALPDLEAALARAGRQPHVDVGVARRAVARARAQHVKRAGRDVQILFHVARQRA